MDVLYDEGYEKYYIAFEDLDDEYRISIWNVILDEDNCPAFKAIDDEEFDYIFEKIAAKHDDYTWGEFEI